MASVADPFVSTVAGLCSLLVPISWLLARWPLRSTLCCLTDKVWETPVPASDSLFRYPSPPSPVLIQLLPLLQNKGS